MAAPYKRRRSASLIRNLWVYRRLVLAAILAGLTLWFILVNSQDVEVRLPFWSTPLKASLGMAILVAAVAGSIITLLITTIVMTMRKLRTGHAHEPDPDPSAIPEERPPSDYASKAKEGFPGSDWSA